MKAYDLLFKAELPGGRAIEVQPFKGEGYHKKFLLPVRHVKILSTRVIPIGQVARNTVAVIEIPDWLASSRGLDPEIDAADPDLVRAAYEAEGPEPDMSL